MIRVSSQHQTAGVRPPCAHEQATRQLPRRHKLSTAIGTDGRPDRRPGERKQNHDEMRRSEHVSDGARRVRAEEQWRPFSYQSQQGTHSRGTGGYRLAVYTAQQQVGREEQS